MARTAFALAILVAAACSKDAAEITKEYRPKAEPRLQKITAAIKEYPSVEKAPIDKLRFSGDSPNALIAPASSFDGTTDTVSLVLPRQVVQSVKDALRGVDPIPSSYNYEPDFKAFLAAKYLVLVSLTPSMGQTTDGTIAAVGGKASVAIYEIDTGKKRDAFEVEATMNDKVLVAQGKEAEGIAADMTRNLYPKLNAAITPYLAAGEKPPF